MKKFELRKNFRSIYYRDRKAIKVGCTLDQVDQQPEIIATFGTKEEALEELKKYESEIRRMPTSAGMYYEITEFYVEENVYDEDGEWLEGGDIWEFAELPTDNI